MTIGTPISLRQMSDGSTVAVPRDGVVAFVGPNNSGKSVSLRDIMVHLTQQHTPPLAVESLGVAKQGSEDELVAWLEQHCHKTFQSGFDYYSRTGSGPVDVRALVNYWSNGPPYHQLGNMLLFYAAVNTREKIEGLSRRVSTLTGSISTSSTFPTGCPRGYRYAK